jgi:hypothetical protein
MHTIRLLLSLFIVVLIVLAVLGWSWMGTHQSGAAALAGRFVLVLTAAAGVVGLAAVWRQRR